MANLFCDDFPGSAQSEWSIFGSEIAVVADLLRYSGTGHSEYAYTPSPSTTEPNVFRVRARLVSSAVEYVTIDALRTGDITGVFAGPDSIWSDGWTGWKVGFPFASLEVDPFKGVDYTVGDWADFQIELTKVGSDVNLRLLINGTEVYDASAGAWTPTNVHAQLSQNVGGGSEPARVVEWDDFRYGTTAIDTGPCEGGGGGGGEGDPSSAFCDPFSGTWRPEWSMITIPAAGNLRIENGEFIFGAVEDTDPGDLISGQFRKNFAVAESGWTAWSVRFMLLDASAPDAVPLHIIGPSDWNIDFDYYEGALHNAWGSEIAISEGVWYVLTIAANAADGTLRSYVDATVMTSLPGVTLDSPGLVNVFGSFIRGDELDTYKIDYFRYGTHPSDPLAATTGPCVASPGSGSCTTQRFQAECNMAVV